MPTTIYTGSDCCRVVNLIECPACGKTMEVANAPYVYSITVGDSIKCCNAHRSQKEFTPEEEVRVQDSLKKALGHKRGHVLVGKKLIKSSVLMTHWQGKTIGVNAKP